MSKQQTIKKFKKFVKGIKSASRAAVIFHTDTDGICSGYIAAEALRRLGREPALIEARAVDALNSSLAKKLKRKKIDKTICTDLVLDQFPDVVKKINEFSDLLVIDHHLVYRESQTDKLLIIKPKQLGVKKYCPASKLVYDLFSQVVDIEDLDWVAACGIIGDMGYSQSKKFVDLVMKKYNIFPAQDLFTTDLGKAAGYIGSTATVRPDKIELALRVLGRADKPKDVLDSELASVFEEVEGEIQKQMKLFKKNVTTHGDLMLCELESKYRIKGPVITRLSAREFPHRTLIIFQRSGDEYVISARRQDQKVAVNELLIEATSDLDGAGGGGHVPAAGGYIRAKDLSKFKKRLVEVHEEMSSSG